MSYQKSEIKHILDPDDLIRIFIKFATVNYMLGNENMIQH